MNYKEQQLMRERMKEMERLVREFAAQLQEAVNRITALETAKTLRLPRKQ